MPLHPLHSAEILAIWKSNNRLPTAASREAWAKARNIDSYLVDKAFWNHRYHARLAGKRIPDVGDGYHLPVGVPPVLSESDEDGVDVEEEDEAGDEEEGEESGKGRGKGKGKAKSGPKPTSKSKTSPKSKPKPPAPSKPALKSLHPLHSAELLAFWKADRRLPSKTSRDAWAKARGIDPRIVDKRFWYYRHRAGQLGQPIPAKDEEYDIPVGKPPDLTREAHEGNAGGGDGGEDGKDVEQAAESSPSRPVRSSRRAITAESSKRKRPSVSDSDPDSATSDSDSDLIPEEEEITVDSEYKGKSKTKTTSSPKTTSSQKRPDFASVSTSPPSRKLRRVPNPTQAYSKKRDQPPVSSTRRRPPHVVDWSKPAVNGTKMRFKTTPTVSASESKPTSSNPKPATKPTSNPKPASKPALAPASKSKPESTSKAKLDPKPVFIVSSDDEAPPEPDVSSHNFNTEVDHDHSTYRSEEPEEEHKYRGDEKQEPERPPTPAPTLPETLSVRLRRNKGFDQFPGNITLKPVSSWGPGPSATTTATTSDKDVNMDGDVDEDVDMDPAPAPPNRLIQYE